MKKNISIAEAKATFSECIREVESGSSVLITRHGKLVAVLVRPDDFEHLERLKKAGPEGGLASIAGGWEDSGELVEILVQYRNPGPLDQVRVQWLCHLNNSFVTIKA